MRACGLSLIAHEVKNTVLKTLPEASLTTNDLLLNWQEAKSSATQMLRTMKSFGYICMRMRAFMSPNSKNAGACATNIFNSCIIKSNVNQGTHTILSVGFRERGGSRHDAPVIRDAGC